MTLVVLLFSVYAPTPDWVLEKRSVVVEQNNRAP